VIAIVVILIVAVIAFTLLVPAGVTVDFINVWAPDNVCGLNSNPIGYYGYNSSTGAVQTFEFQIPNYNLSSCSISSMVTNSSGFEISGFTLPIPITGNGTANVNITITSPTSPFTGNMNLVVG
jgi:hypothetical protein